MTRPRRSLQPRPPTYPWGFAILGGVALLFAGAMAGLLLDASPGGGVVERAFAALLGALALVTAEALVRVRPWAWRACVALALAFVGAIAALSLVGSEDEATVFACFVLLLLLSTFFLVPALAYVYDHFHDHHPPAGRGGRP